MYCQTRHPHLELSGRLGPLRGPRQKLLVNVVILGLCGDDLFLKTLTLTNPNPHRYCMVIEAMHPNANKLNL